MEAGLRKGVEGAGRGGGRLVDSGGGAEGDFGARLLGGGVDDLMPGAAIAFHPGAIDILVEVALHPGLRMFEHPVCCGGCRFVATRNAWGNNRSGEQEVMWHASSVSNKPAAPRDRKSVV